MISFYTSVEGKNIHFLKKGKGPVIILFHASPLSSNSLKPLITKLSKHFTVIAPDTPGYGQSDAFKKQPDNLSTYCHFFKFFFDKIGLTKFSIYGTATGAQIGIRYSLLFPEQIINLFLDNSAHFNDEERIEIVKNYFPDFSPVKDGTHLINIWNTVEKLFQYFPWCFQSAAYKLNTPLPPPQVRHFVSLEYINASSNYHWAYRLAFEHERKEYIDQLKVPTVIFRWENSIIKTYTDRLFEGELNSNIKAYPIKKEVDRYTAIVSAIVDHYLDGLFLNEQIFTLNATRKTHNKISEDLMKLISKLPDFPEVEKTGNYLLEAWNTIEVFSNVELGLEEKNQSLIYWAKRA